MSVGCSDCPWWEMVRLNSGPYLLGAGPCALMVNKNKFSLYKYIEKNNIYNLLRIPINNFMSCRLWTIYIPECYTETIINTGEHTAGWSQLMEKTIITLTELSLGRIREPGRSHENSLQLTSNVFQLWVVFTCPGGLITHVFLLFGHYSGIASPTIFNHGIAIWLGPGHGTCKLKIEKR